jgi:hypothetical protein
MKMSQQQSPLLSLFSHVVYPFIWSMIRSLSLPFSQNANLRPVLFASADAYGFAEVCVIHLSQMQWAVDAFAETQVV